MVGCHQDGKYWNYNTYKSSIDKAEGIYLRQNFIKKFWYVFCSPGNQTEPYNIKFLSYGM
jgi:hypothetical protein